MSLLDTFKGQVEERISDLRMTRNWMAADTRVKYTLNLLEQLQKEHGGNLVAYIDGCYGHVLFQTGELTGLKDPKLEMLLNSLEYANFDEQDCSDMALWRERTYRYVWRSHNEDYPSRRFSVNVEAKFAENSETCKRVVIGYTQPSEPTPIYKLTCEGDGA